MARHTSRGQRRHSNTLRRVLTACEAFESLADELLAISSNTLLHSDFRGARVTLGEGSTSEPMALSFLTVALAFRRFAESPAKKVIRIARNDRSMNRVGAALAGRNLGQVLLHGAENDLMLMDTTSQLYQSPVIDSLWARRNAS